MIQNRDIGKIRRGQKVQIKYFAYPTQDYGPQSGIITEIAAKPSGEPGKPTSFHTNPVDLIEGCSRDHKIPQTL